MSRSTAKYGGAGRRQQRAQEFLCEHGMGSTLDPLREAYDLKIIPATSIFGVFRRYFSTQTLVCKARIEAA